MKRVLRRHIAVIYLLLSSQVNAQEKHARPAAPAKDSITSHHSHIYDANNEVDLIDIVQKLFDKNATKRTDTTKVHSLKPRVSGLPVAGYTLQTGFAGILIGNVAFYTSEYAQENLSNVLVNLTYSQYKQIILPVLANIWTDKNKYNIAVDWRFVKFPSYTYGLGGYTNLSDGYTIDYSGMRIHQSILRSVVKNVYAGVGYAFDYFWDIREVDPPNGKVTDFQSYGLTNTEQASGPTVNFLYDNRKNSINPQNGGYINAVYRPNFTFLGSDANWQSLALDLRKYIRLPFRSDNVLALWSYDWFTLGGTPPYLLLPNTGGDPASNSGRGYIQGRFRSRNMLYGEAEYRFNITRNELVGGVVFANVQSVTEEASGQFETLWPGWGAGLRLRLNKFSRTNVAVDYGLGLGGSRGFFVNLGEVF